MLERDSVKVYTRLSQVWQRGLQWRCIAVRTLGALQGELCLHQAKETMGKLTCQLITANELEQCSSSCLP